MYMYTYNMFWRYRVNQSHNEGKFPISSLSSDQLQHVIESICKCSLSQGAKLSPFLQYRGEHLNKTGPSPQVLMVAQA